MVDSVPPEVSVVIPVLNEAENVPPMCRRVQAALDSACSDFEMIFVGGGSNDGTEEAVISERRSDDRVKLLWLSRNFGHQEKLTAGLDAATGKAVITMDGDLQHPPEVLPQLIQEWRQGTQVVTTTKVSSSHAGFCRRILTRAGYSIINRLTGLELKGGCADFRLLDRVAVDAIRNMPERARFLRGMVQWVGYKQTTIAYQAAERESGASKYPFKSLIRLLLLGTLSFSAMPLYLLAILGFALATVSFAYGAYAVFAKLFADVSIVGWASLLAALTFLGGVQLLSLGVVGAYVARIYEEAKGRPVYLVQGSYGLGTELGRSKLAEPASQSMLDQGSLEGRMADAQKRVEAKGYADLSQQEVRLPKRS